MLSKENLLLMSYRLNELLDNGCFFGRHFISIEALNDLKQIQNYLSNLKTKKIYFFLQTINIPYKYRKFFLKNLSIYFLVHRFSGNFIAFMNLNI